MGLLDPGGREGLDGLAQRLDQRRMLALQADLRLLQPVHQAGVLLAALVLGPGEPALHRFVEAAQLLPFVVVLRPLDGGGELVEQMAQMLFHSPRRYRTRGLYLIRWGCAASAPRRFVRSVS